MKRLLFGFLVLGLSFGFSGCTIKPDIKPNIITINVGVDNYNYTNINNKRINYQVFGVYKNLDNSKINSILNKMKEKINAKTNSLRKVSREYSHNEKVKICKKNVYFGRYGRYRNVLEKNKLIDYCLNKISNKRKYYYIGIASSAVIKNNILIINKVHASENAPMMFSKEQAYKNVITKSWQKIKFIAINKRFYLLHEFSESTSVEEIKYNYKNLLNIIKEEKIKSLSEPIKEDWNKFVKFL